MDYIFPFRYRWWFYYAPFVETKYVYILQHGWITATPHIVCHYSSSHTANGNVKHDAFVTDTLSLEHWCRGSMCVHCTCHVSQNRKCHIRFEQPKYKWRGKHTSIAIYPIRVEMTFQISKYYGRWQHFTGAKSIIGYLIQKPYQAYNYLCNYARTLQVTCSFQWINK